MEKRKWESRCGKEEGGKEMWKRGRGKWMEEERGRDDQEEKEREGEINK